MESNSVCNHTRDKQTDSRESDVFITSMITDQIEDTKSYYQLIIKVTISEKRRIASYERKVVIG